MVKDFVQLYESTTIAYQTNKKTSTGPSIHTDEKEKELDANTINRVINNSRYLRKSDILSSDGYSTEIGSFLKVNVDEVIVMDGIERAVIAVNNSIPGPPIIAYEGQELVVHVKNHLLSDAITIHWHGLHQRGSPFMDGVAYVTQCPIEAGQTFTYRFQVGYKFFIDIFKCIQKLLKYL